MSLEPFAFIEPKLEKIGSLLAKAEVVAHADLLLAHQRQGGGFAGRAGGGDLYYTAFAVRSLAGLGRLSTAVARACAGFLATAVPGGIVDLLQWLYTARMIAAQAELPPGPAVKALLAAHRSIDGGWAKLPGGPGSTYWTYLALLCLQECGMEVEKPAEAAAFIRSRQCKDGGFAETDAAVKGSTNATAAALGATMLLPGSWSDEQQQAIPFFLTMRVGNGGFRAGAMVPIPDLLSTFTALITLCMIDGQRTAAPVGARSFLDSCRLPGGGWGAASWDQESDPEYTFYGLCLEALIRGSDDDK